MEIQHTDNGKEGYFKAMDGDTQAGLMDYTWKDADTFVIEHTVGNPEFKGIGTTLLDAAVAFAREKNLKIIPQCPFAKKMFERNPDLNDVLSQ
jgi:predicted GNAT family acetyltransferase